MDVYQQTLTLHVFKGLSESTGLDTRFFPSLESILTGGTRHVRLDDEGVGAGDRAGGDMKDEERVEEC